jgi:hypothetical protein
VPHCAGAAVALLSLTVVASAGAHHSFAAFDEAQEIRIEGTLASFDFVNPHARIELVVTRDDGRELRWNAEWAGAGSLLGQGVSAASLAVGDALVLTGNPARDTEHHALRLTSLLRPADGFAWGFAGETSD